MSKISFEEIFARNQTNKFYKYEKNREVGEKIMIYEINSLVSIVYTYKSFVMMLINHFASALHKYVLYKNNVNAVCLCFLTLCIPAIQLFISTFGRPFRVCCIWMNGVRIRNASFMYITLP